MKYIKDTMEVLGAVTLALSVWGIFVVMAFSIHTITH